jgi:hypothetical protein
VEFMTLRSVATSRAAYRPCGLAGLGLIVLAAMPCSSAFAAEPPAAPAKTEAAPTPAAKPPAPEAVKPTAEAAKPAAVPTAPTKAVAKPTAPALPAECVRTGQRVVAALARDDTGAATQFYTFYNAFKCPLPHLAQAFACLAKLQAANPGLSNPSPEQVAQCWDDPATLPKVLPPPPPVAPQQ